MNIDNRAFRIERARESGYFVTNDFRRGDGWGADVFFAGTLGECLGWIGQKFESVQAPPSCSCSR